MKFLLLFLLISTAQATVYKPDIKLTPGSFCSLTDEDYYEERYVERVPVCKRNVTSATKNKVYKMYSVVDSEKVLYTIDHKISLFLGGSNHVDNLWPQLRSNSSAQLENQTFILLNGGKITHKKALDLVLSVKK